MNHRHLRTESRHTQCRTMCELQCRNNHALNTLRIAVKPIFFFFKLTPIHTSHATDSSSATNSSHGQCTMHTMWNEGETKNAFIEWILSLNNSAAAPSTLHTQAGRPTKTRRSHSFEPFAVVFVHSLRVRFTMHATNDAVPRALPCFEFVHLCQPCVLCVLCVCAVCGARTSRWFPKTTSSNAFSQYRSVRMFMCALLLSLRSIHPMGTRTRINRFTCCFYFPSFRFFGGGRCWWPAQPSLMSWILSMTTIYPLVGSRIYFGKCVIRWGSVHWCWS